MVMLTPIIGQGGLVQGAQQSAAQMGQMGAAMGQAIQQGRTRKLMQPALMGDPAAMQQLMAVNPQAGMQVQQQLSQQAQAAQQKKMQAQAWMQKNQDYADKFLKDTATTMQGIPEEKREDYFNQRLNTLKQVAGPEQQWIDDITYEGWKEPLAAMATAGAGGKFKESDIEGLVFNESIGQYSISPLAMQKIEEAKAKGVELDAKDRKPILDAVTKMTDKARDVKTSANVLAELKENDSAAAQLSAVIKFMKVLDPNSVVRTDEGEQVVATGGLTDQLMGYVNQLRGEGALSSDVMTDLRDTARRIANQEIDAASSNASGYIGSFEETIPETFKGKLNERIPSRFEIKDEKKGKASSASGQAAPQAAIDFLIANPDQVEAFRAKYGYVPEGM